MEINAVNQSALFFFLDHIKKLNMQTCVELRCEFISGYRMTIKHFLLLETRNTPSLLTLNEFVVKLNGVLTLQKKPKRNSRIDEISDSEILAHPT